MGLSESLPEQTDLEILQSRYMIYYKPNSKLIVDYFFKYHSKTFSKDSIICHSKIFLRSGQTISDGSYQYCSTIFIPEEQKEEIIDDITNVIIERLGICVPINVTIDDFVDISVTVPKQGPSQGPFQGPSKEEVPTSL
jgi:hypothetical protein